MYVHVCMYGHHIYIILDVRATELQLLNRFLRLIYIYENHYLLLLFFTFIQRIGCQPEIITIIF